MSTPVMAFSRPAPPPPGFTEDLAPAVERYLPPGQILASWEPARITTILGSCVAVCLWDAELGVGGMNHFLLPRGVQTSAATAARFGNLAIPRLVESVLAFGGRQHDLRAKVFGGACVLEAFRGSTRHLGAQNVAVALDLVRKEGIPILAEDVGGDRGRKLVFSTSDGSAWVRTLSSASSSNSPRVEKE